MMTFEEAAAKVFNLRDAPEREDPETDWDVERKQFQFEDDIRRSFLCEVVQQAIVPQILKCGMDHNDPPPAIIMSAYLTALNHGVSIGVLMERQDTLPDTKPTNEAKPARFPRLFQLAKRICGVK